jgi:hypothetical protein
MRSVRSGIRRRRIANTAKPAANNTAYTAVAIHTGDSNVSAAQTITAIITAAVVTPTTNGRRVSSPIRCRNAGVARHTSRYAPTYPWADTASRPINTSRLDPDTAR